MSTATEFHVKISKIQGELNAPKGQFNSFGKYKYRSCEDIMGALKPLLLEAELTQTVSDEIVLIGERYYVKATVTVTDGGTSISSSAYAREDLTKKGMDVSQLTGSTSSYARKYALSGFYNIDDNKDADTQDNSKQQQTKPTNAKIKPQTISELESLLVVKGYDHQRLFGYISNTFKRDVSNISEMTEIEGRKSIEAISAS